ncbi:MAG: hypothetical protein M3P06_05250 [Acidobacteriota bacterium]|nr:hypothetical protein [Acidobacteriota bacterium]
MMLVNVEGEARLVRVRRDGARFTFDGVPAEDTPVELSASHRASSGR